MRIGVVTEEYYPSLGGIPEHVHNFAREARRLGHTVKIVTSVMPDAASGAPPDEPQATDVLRVGASRPLVHRGAVGRVTGGTGVGAALREILARERFDVMHVHAPLTPVLPLLAIHHATGPVVGTFHPSARGRGCCSASRGALAAAPRRPARRGDRGLAGRGHALRRSLRRGRPDDPPRRRLRALSPAAGGCAATTTAS